MAYANRHQYQGIWAQDICIQATVTIPSVATAAGTSVAVTVAGAAVGDSVDVIPQVNTAGLLISASVTAANTVTVVARNDSGATVNLGAQLFYFVVSRVNASIFTS